MADYQIVRAAEADLEAIYLYTEMTFGIRQAEAYLAGLGRTFDMLAEFPRTGRSADALRPGLFRFPYQSHVIFHSIEANGIVIRRVLHGHSNMSARFST